MVHEIRILTITIILSMVKNLVIKLADKGHAIQDKKLSK
jgi:hypothetical protein